MSFKMSATLQDGHSGQGEEHDSRPRPTAHIENIEILLKSEGANKLSTSKDLDEANVIHRTSFRSLFQRKRSVEDKNDVSKARADQMSTEFELSDSHDLDLNKNAVLKANSAAANSRKNSIKSAAAALKKEGKRLRLVQKTLQGRAEKTGSWSSEVSSSTDESENATKLNRGKVEEESLEDLGGTKYVVPFDTTNGPHKLC